MCCVSITAVRFFGAYCALLMVERLSRPNPNPLHSGFIERSSCIHRSGDFRTTASCLGPLPREGQTIPHLRFPAQKNQPTEDLPAEEGCRSRDAEDGATR